MRGKSAVQWKMQGIRRQRLPPILALTAFLAAMPSAILIQRPPGKDHLETSTWIAELVQKCAFCLELFSILRRKPERWKSFTLKILRGFPESDIISVTQTTPIHARLDCHQWTLKQTSLNYPRKCGTVTRGFHG